MVDQAQLEKEEGEREAQEVRRLMEIDADEEIEELKARLASCLPQLVTHRHVHRQPDVSQRHDRGIKHHVVQLRDEAGGGGEDGAAAARGAGHPEEEGGRLPGAH